MNVYMLRKKDGGWYKASHGRGGKCWTDQRYATVWSSKHGPAGAHSRLNKNIETEIVVFHLTPTNISFVTDHMCGDWEGVYADGELKLQGHSVEIEEVFDAIGIPCKSFDANIVDSLPEKFEDLEIRE